MAEITVPHTQVLAMLQLSPAMIQATPSAWKRSSYQAIWNWLTRYQATSNAPNLEQVRGYLEVFYLLCELEAWEQAETILTLQLQTPTSAELHQQLFIWGYYREQIRLYERLLHRKDVLLDLTCLSGLGNAWDSLGSYAQAIDYHQHCLSLAQQIGNSTAEGRALCNLGNAYLSMHHYSEAERYYTQYLAFTQRLGDRRFEGSALGNLGNLYRLR